MNEVSNNGSKEMGESDIDIKKLLVIEKVESIDTVSVQLNGEFVERDNFASTTLKDGDEIDFLYFMGGGQK